MRALHNIPLKRKLTVISMLTSGVALLITCAVFIGYDHVTLRREIVRELQINADIIGANSASSLSFNDNDSAALTLRSLAAHASIVRACIYDAQGNVFATYRQEPGANSHWSIEHADRAGEAWPDAQPDRAQFNPHDVELFQAIAFSGEAIGTIYLQADLNNLHERRQRYVGIAGAVLLLALGLTWAIATRLQRVIVEPIVRLATLAGVVGSQKNYALRAPEGGHDEVGRLIAGFNDMLAQIQARDAELRSASENLERRVEERTQSLERAREEMTREKERFQFIFNFSPIGVSLYSTDSATGFSENYLINDSHLRICGVSRDALRDPNIFASLTPPEDLARQKPLQDRLRRGEIDQFSIEKRYRRPDGRVVWVVFSAQKKTYPDGREETLTTIVDVTDLKAAQEEAVRERERFKFIFDSLPVGVAWMMHGRRDTRIVNEAHARITGVPPERCGDVNNYVEVTHPDDRPIQAAFIKQLSRGEIDRYSLEKRYWRPDGKWTWAVLSVRLLASEDGDTQELTTLVDITERKEAEVELGVIHGKLLETSRQAGMAEVATGVLHNVGNVLNSVNVSATLVADQVRRSKAPNVGKLRELFDQHRADLGRYLTEDPKGRIIPTYLGTLADALAAEQRTIVAEIENLQKNIAHIKDIVAMQQSYAKTSGVVETVSVPDLVEDALRMNAGSLARHDVEISRLYDGRPVITVEKNKVLQILVNLIRNAKYACDDSGRRDKLIALRTTVEPDGVAITISDNGVGIPSENLTRIFAHGFTTRKEGHGFGLHSGALAAKGMGGSLSVHSDGPGTGARFTLRLPLSPPPPSS